MNNFTVINKNPIPVIIDNYFDSDEDQINNILTKSESNDDLSYNSGTDMDYDLDNTNNNDDIGNINDDNDTNDIGDISDSCNNIEYELSEEYEESESDYEYYNEESEDEEMDLEIEYTDKQVEEYFDNTNDVSISNIFVKNKKKKLRDSREIYDEQFKENNIYNKNKKKKRIAISAVTTSVVVVGGLYLSRLII